MEEDTQTLTMDSNDETASQDAEITKQETQTMDTKEDNICQDAAEEDTQTLTMDSNDETASQDAEITKQETQTMDTKEDNTCQDTAEEDTQTLAMDSDNEITSQDIGITKHETQTMDLNEDNTSQDSATAKKVPSRQSSQDFQSGTRRNCDDQYEQNFPSTLEGFGYKFDEDGELRDISSNSPFVFDVSSSRSYNQKRYEALGEVIEKYVYELLVKNCHLEKITLPVDHKKDEPTNFIFVSDDAKTNREKLMILIHGSGVVRAGQWARRLIINDNLESGTQIPYIKRAQQEGYGVVVLNTNYNYDEKRRFIRGSECPENHFVYVWDKIISEMLAKKIFIVAHSYGGAAIVNTLSRANECVLQRISAIALTDSVHSLHEMKTRRFPVFWRKVAVNWVTSSQKTDTVLSTGNDIDCQCRSAGVTKHEETSFGAFNAVFKYFSQKAKKTNN